MDNKILIHAWSMWLPYLLTFQEIQIGPDHQAEVPETMGPNYEDGESDLFVLILLLTNILI